MMLQYPPPFSKGTSSICTVAYSGSLDTEDGTVNKEYYVLSVGTSCNCLKPDGWSERDERRNDCDKRSD